jgi:hypothetical protein
MDFDFDNVLDDYCDIILTFNFLDFTAKDTVPL